jgi:hypothetical protein
VEVDNEDPMDGFRERCAVTYSTKVAVNIDNRTKPIPIDTEGLLDGQA